jgi:hypothetical protein
MPTRSVAALSTLISYHHLLIGQLKHHTRYNHHKKKTDFASNRNRYIPQARPTEEVKKITITLISHPELSINYFCTKFPSKMILFLVKS